jgi:hypothetical protein
MKMTSRRLVVACIGLAFLTAGRATAQSSPITLAQLSKMNVDELTHLFEQASPGEIPRGYARGKVLLLTDSKRPRLQARLANLAWKGKHFEADGAYINQWPGFQALRGQAELGISSYDGKPCLLLQYPPETPLFGNTYDEMRQIAPGLYLARLYERCPCPHFNGYIAIQVCCSCP